MNATSFCVWVTRTPTCHSGLYPGGLHATDDGEISSFGPAPERRHHLHAASKRRGRSSQARSKGTGLWSGWVPAWAARQGALL